MMEEELQIKYYKVQKEFVPLYMTKKEELLKRLTPGQVALLEFSQRRLRRIEGRNRKDWKEEVQNFGRKWRKIIFTEDKHLDVDYFFSRAVGRTAKQVLEGTNTTVSIGGKIVPWVSFLNWSWWRSRKEWSAEKLVRHSLTKLEKLVSLGSSRESLLIEFREEFLKLFPETQEVNLWTILEEIPQDVWRKIYRKSQTQFHPDRGGDQEVSKWLSKLNNGMRVWRKLQ